MIIGLLFFRLRPFANLVDVHQLISKGATENSFPSGHAAVAFALAFTIFFADREWGWAFLVIATLVSLGRVFVGVHYPLDVVGGFFIGLLVAWLVRRLERMEGRKIERTLHGK
jgi:undecaprenyl-diphosphatase